MLRVIAITTNDFGAHNHDSESKVTESTQWKGSNIEELNRLYPPSEIFGADPLGHSEIEDGLIRFDYRFEQLRGDGSWEPIPDPRTRITPLTEREREIDRENRRDFPGDYFTGCDACGYESCDGRCEDEASYA